MRAHEFINELFQPGKDWRWSFQGSEEAVAVFHVGEIPYMFHAYGADGEWEAEFKQHGSKLSKMQKFGLTGTGNSAEVMSTVVDIMRAFLEKYQDKIQVLTFSAKEDSRQGLYARMIKRLLPDWRMQQKDEFFTLFAPTQATESHEFVTEQSENISTAYHVTTVPIAEDIQHDGLQPADGKVFLVADLGNDAQLRKELGTVIGWMYAKTEHTDDPLTLLKINVAGIPLEYYNGWYVATKPIEPGRIKDLGESELARYY